LTNRHIAEPWWEDEKAAPLLTAGLKPVFIRLRAFFQERPTGVPIEVLRIDERLDIALAKTVGWTPLARPLVLHGDSAKVEEGQPIILIGYPTGLEAVLAKLKTRSSRPSKKKPARAVPDSTKIIRTKANARHDYQRVSLGGSAACAGL
jgi:hypothetical protein